MPILEERNTEKLVQSFLTAWMNQVKENIKKSGEYTTGRTSALFEVKGMDLWGWAFLGVLETGRKPGKQPPSQLLREWVRVKLGIIEQKQINSISYLISRKIGIYGTQLFRKGGRKDIYSNVFTEENFRKLVNSIADAEVKNVYQEFLNSLEVNKV